MKDLLLSELKQILESLEASIQLHSETDSFDHLSLETDDNQVFYDSSHAEGIGLFIKKIASRDDFHMIGLAQTVIDRASELRDLEVSQYDPPSHDEITSLLMDSKRSLTATDIGHILDLGSGVKANKYLQSIDLISKTEEGSGGWKLNSEFSHLGEQVGIHDGTKGWVRWNHSVIDFIKTLQEQE